MEIEPYSFGWDQGPREDVAVFFKLKAPKEVRTKDPFISRHGPRTFRESHVCQGDPGVALTFALSGLGITVLPLWLAKRQNIRNGLVAILPLWKPGPITLCALYRVRLD
jgi:DNA-binding transcriptional LysR family regulator